MNTVRIAVAIFRLTLILIAVTQYEIYNKYNIIICSNYSNMFKMMKRPITLQLSPQNLLFCTGTVNPLDYMDSCLWQKTAWPSHSIKWPGRWQHQEFWLNLMIMASVIGQLADGNIFSQQLSHQYLFKLTHKLARVVKTQTLATVTRLIAFFASPALYFHKARLSNQTDL